MAMLVLLAACPPALAVSPSRSPSSTKSRTPSASGALPNVSVTRSRGVQVSPSRSASASRTASSTRTPPPQASAQPSPSSSSQSDLPLAGEPLGPSDSAPPSPSLSPPVLSPTAVLASPTPSQTQSRTSSPSASRSPLPMFQYIAGPWSDCSKSCGGGKQWRDLFCLRNFFAADGTLYAPHVVSDAECDASGLQPIPTSRSCNTGSCLLAHWQVSSQWSTCSSPCMDPNDPSSLGTTTRPAAVCKVGILTVKDNTCVKAGKPKPVTSRPCNRVLCPASWFTWQTGPWSSCTSNIGCGRGTSSRTVQCVDISGAAVADARSCNITMKPESTIACDTGVACPCRDASGQDQCRAAIGDHSVCNTTSQLCTCSEGWAGSTCNVTALAFVNASAPCADGTTPDRTGHCCTHIDVLTGLCCASGDVVGINGRCCVGGQLDGCGVCNGTGVMLDRFGYCCQSPVASNGVCCDFASGTDSCGVCAGVNHCPAVVKGYVPVVHPILAALSSIAGKSCCFESRLIVHDPELSCDDVAVACGGRLSGLSARPGCQLVHCALQKSTKQEQSRGTN